MNVNIFDKLFVHFNGKIYPALTMKKMDISIVMGYVV